MTRSFPLLMLLMAFPHFGLAQPLDWLESKHVQVRKSFVGTSKDSGLPAAVTYMSSDGRDDYYNIDIALKISQKEWDKNSWQGRVYPVIEHHRKTEFESEVDKASIALNFESEKQLDVCTVDRIVVNFCKAFFMDMSIKAERDSEKNTTTRHYTFFGGLITTGLDGWPGTWIETVNDVELLRYFPIIGIEHYDNLLVEKKVDGKNIVLAPALEESFVSTRLNVELNIFPATLQENLVLIVNHTQRYLDGSSPFVNDKTRFTEVSLDYYLDASNRASVGLNYNAGQNPNRNFLQEESLSVGFKIKVGT